MISNVHVRHAEILTLEFGSLYNTKKLTQIVLNSTQRYKNRTVKILEVVASFG